MRQLSCREMKRRAPGFTAAEWGSWFMSARPQGLWYSISVSASQPGVFLNWQGRNRYTWETRISKWLSSASGLGPRICILSNTFPGAADTADLGSYFEKHWFRQRCYQSPPWLHGTTPNTVRWLYGLLDLLLCICICVIVHGEMCGLIFLSARAS